MKRSLLALSAALGVLAAGCTSSTPDAAAVGATTISPTTAPTTATAGEDTTTSAPETGLETTASTQATDTTSSIPLLSEVLDTSAGWPIAVTLWDSTGARKQGHLAGEVPTVVEGPLATLAEVPLQGWVYQREQDSNAIFFSDGLTERELLVATGEQSLTLEGVWLPDGDGETAEVIYQRFDPDGQNSIQTLRGYSMATGDVREITVTGGFESATNFGLVNNRLVAARFFGEGHYELTLVDLQTGDRPYRSSDADFDCFDGGDPECPEYDQAVAIGTDIFGFGAVPNPSTGIVDQMGIYRFDTTTGVEAVVASYPWDNGAYYAVDMVELNNVIAISLADGPFRQGLGEPLPALLFDIGTAQTTLAPEAGFVQPSWLS